MEELLDIKINYNNVISRINETSEKCGRKSDDVKLIVVTKSQPVEKILAVIGAGAKYLGENYPEETEKKIAILGREQPAHWHMIGHLQSRKIKIIAEYFSYFHSLDRIDIAQKLNTLLAQQHRILPVLLEVNVSGEESKQGLAANSKENWSEIINIAQEISRLPNLVIQGLMTMPPFFDDPEKSRPYFQKTRELMVYMQNSLPAVRLSELSMGTSVDYCVAIEEGSTFVRIGQAIMGARIKR